MLVTFFLGVAVATVWVLRNTPPPALQEPPCRLSAENVSPLPQQITSTLDKHHVPRHLQERLARRIQAFVRCQQTEEWDEVAGLLGRFGWRRETYNPEQKRSILEGLQEKPIVSFTPLCLTFSTEIIDKPLSGKWWHIHAKVEEHEAAEFGTTLEAYLDEGEWYFVPTGLTSDCRISL